MSIFCTGNLVLPGYRSGEISAEFKCEINILKWNDLWGGIKMEDLINVMKQLVELLQQILLQQSRLLEAVFQKINNKNIHDNRTR